MNKLEALDVVGILRDAAVAGAAAFDNLARAFRRISTPTPEAEMAMVEFGLFSIEHLNTIRPYNHPKERRRRHIVNALNRTQP